MKSSQTQSDRLTSAVWAVTAAFGCYFCMYAFRKPFTAGKFESPMVFGMGFKTVLVITQVLGYTLSKFLGIKVIAEMPPTGRAWTLLLLVGIAECTLILFGAMPRPWNAICLFFNGLTLGLVFGLVLGFLEGRRSTEALTAGLCASFILADGVMKSTGTSLIDWGISEDWMPSIAGAFYIVPFVVCVAMLAKIPQPNSCDIATRRERHVMHAVDRMAFLKRHGIGLAPLILMFFLVTLLRSIRADFAPEIWIGLEVSAVPSTFSNSEIWVALGVITVNGTMVMISDNRRAFLAALTVCALGISLLATALMAYHAHIISGFTFMVMIGLGLYIPYVAVHTTIFERLLAMTRDRGNLGFLMCLADSMGYLGYVVVLLARQLWSAEVNFVVWLSVLCWITIGLSFACLIVSWRHFTIGYAKDARRDSMADATTQGLI